MSRTSQHIFEIQERDALDSWTDDPGERQEYEKVASASSGNGSGLTPHKSTEHAQETANETLRNGPQLLSQAI